MGAIFLLRPHAVQIVWGLSLRCERAASADHDTLRYAIFDIDIHLQAWRKATKRDQRNPPTGRRSE